MRLFPLLGLLALAPVLRAQSGAAWMGYSSSARNLAEAGGLGSMADGTDSLGLNPAGLAELPGKGELAASYSLWPGQIAVQNLQGALRGSLGVLAVHGSWIDFGNIGAYTVDPISGVQATGGSMNPHASDVGLGLETHFGRVAAGLSGHVLMEDLVSQGTSSALAMDAGARMDVLPQLTAAVSLVNLGQSLDGSPLPTALRTGLALRGAQGSGWELGVEASNPMVGGQADLAAAFRYKIASAVTLRAGWLQGQGLAGSWSMGASFQLGIVGADYGFRQLPGFDPVQDFSLRLIW